VVGHLDGGGEAVCVARGLVQVDQRPGELQV
jgi:hypothetical protein